MTRLPWRRFECDQDVWEIELDGAICRSRTEEEDAGSDEAAIARYVQMIEEKLWKGYAEIVSPGQPAPIMPLLPGDPHAELARLIDQAGLSAKRAAIEAMVKPALHVRLRRVAEEDLPVGQSRFGGRPDLPSGTPWPMHETRPLAFVAQLRLEALGPGLVSFFVLADYDEKNANEPTYLSVCRVLYSTGAVERTSLPPNLMRSWNGHRVSDPYPAHAVETFPTVTFPTWHSPAWKTLGLTPDDLLDGVTEPFQAWDSARIPGSRGTYVLGYRMNRDRDREPGRVLLLACGTDYSAQQPWGDADLLYYWIAPAALKAESFDAVTSNYAD